MAGELDELAVFKDEPDNSWAWEFTKQGLQTRALLVRKAADALTTPPQPLDGVTEEDWDDINEALDDAVSDAEGRINAFYTLHHLAKRGFNVVRTALHAAKGSHNG